MGQRYTHPVASARLAAGNCPECGEPPNVHTGAGTGRCSLTDTGVHARLLQFQQDLAASAPDRYTATVTQLTSGPVRAVVDSACCVVLRFPLPLDSFTVTDVDGLCRVLQDVRLMADVLNQREPPVAERQLDVSAAERAVLVRRMTDFAAELTDPLVCREPAYGAPGYAHCAACCGGTGLIITCPEEAAIADAAAALRAAALIAEMD